MNPWLFLGLWIGSHAMQLAFGATALRKQQAGPEPKRLGSLSVSFYGSILPWITLILFIVVFVIGGSSNVRQLAGKSGYELWSLWCGMWPLLFVGNPVAFLVLAITAMFPPYPPRYWQSFVARLCGVVGAGVAWYMTVTFFPDA